LWVVDCYYFSRLVGRRKRSVLLVVAPAALSRFSYLAGHHAGLFFSVRKQRRAGLLYLRNRAVGMRLYVGNLSYSVSNQQLEELFAQFGQVKSAQVIMDRDTGRSKGFGFVEMVDANQARAAIEGLNLKEIDGRSLTVNEARPREERGGGGGGRGGGGGGRGGGYGGGGGGRRY
jgi:uncharacterized membrane protein YgcG